tara:strand:- start:1407 stop:4133 length:2727 start_codon:yes stop_codon:yes gene_type:complete
MATKSAIRVYNTKANALIGNETGMIADSNDDVFHDNLTGADSGSEAAVANTESATPYHIFERFYYRIEANEPVSEFHIDWDDGEDSSKEKRNIQIIKLEEPATYCVVDHVYTFSRIFYPLIRVKSVDGFLSKWYTHHENISNHRLDPILKLPVAISSHNTTGQQSFSRVSLNKNNTNTLPYFIPSNVPPVAVLKTDKKRIYSGIANHILEQNFTSSSENPVLYAYLDSDTATAVDVKLTVETDDNHVREYLIRAANVITQGFWEDKLANRPSSSNYLQRHNAASELPKLCVPFGNYNNNPTNKAVRLLRAELMQVDTFGDDDRIFIKAFNIGDSQTTSQFSPDENRSICVLSNGNPIIDITDPMFSANVDLSESYSKTSTSSITKYIIDDDTMGCFNYRGNQIKSANATEEQINSGEAPTGNIFSYVSTFKTLQEASSTTKGVAFRDPTDILKGGDGNFYDRLTKSTLNISYSHDSNGHKKDSDGRYLDFYRLIRGQVQDNTSSLWDDNKGNDYSLTRHYRRAGQYESSLAGGAVRIPTRYGSQGLLMYSASDSYTNGVSDANWKNVGALSTTTAHIFNDGGIGGTVYKLMTGGTTANPEGQGSGNTQTNVPKNYLLMCQTKIFDKIYFRTNNTNLGRLESTAINDVDLTAWYSTKDASGNLVWKLLKIVDNTNGFSNSGSVTFKRPTDWDKTTYHSQANTAGPVDLDNDGDDVDPADKWDFASYAILLGINVNSAVGFNTQIISAYPYGDEDTQLIKIVDPHHISLNSIAIAQSISFTRSGKFQTITDRFGKSEIRKMGVNGGMVKFGSVDLGDTNEQGNRKKIKEYQQNATPVYLDVTHKSGEKTRFFGVITNMSEDHPTGRQNPKYGVQMQVSHLIELDSAGVLLSDKISIGGKTDEPRKFFVST